jgi:hypothetical protein
MPGYAGAGGWGRGGGEAMSKRKLELIEQRKQLDATIGANRDLIDGHARGCRYRELAEVAAQLVKHAQAAVACSAELDKILVEEWEKRRGGR